jgi:hypothetical protein
MGIDPFAAAIVADMIFADIMVGYHMIWKPYCVQGRREHEIQYSDKKASP